VRLQENNDIFGIFIDFANVFNTINHTLLFERIVRVLKQDEMRFIQAIYSKTRTKLGRFSVRPSVGVAQGSPRALSFFHIYVEDLIKELVKKNSRTLAGPGTCRLPTGLVTGYTNVKNKIKPSDEKHRPFSF